MVLVDARVLLTDHAVALGANDPIAFEIRNLNVWMIIGFIIQKSYNAIHQQNWSMIDSKLLEMNNDSNMLVVRGSLLL